MSTFSEIRAALESEIANVPGIPSAANRAWENVRFEPTPGTPWVRMTLLPGSTRPAYLGADPKNRIDGLFQVDIFHPVGSGPASADTLADAVRLRYKVSRTLTAGSVGVRFNWSERMPGRVDGPWYAVSVRASWYTYAS